MKSVLMFTLAASLVTGCSQTNSPQSAAGGQQAASTTPATAEAQPASAARTPEPSGAPAAQQSIPPASASSSPAAAAPSSPAAATSSSPALSQPVAQAAPPAPRFREVTIPAGTSLSVTVLSTLASNNSKVEDPVRGTLARPVVVSGTTAVPSGAEMSGSVMEVNQSGRVKGKASIAFRFDRVVVRGENYRIQTARITREAEQNKTDDLKKGGIGAGLGAIVGGVVGGGKGAAIGAVAGGTGGVLATKGDEVQLAPGTVVTVVLQQSVTVQVPLE